MNGKDIFLGLRYVDEDIIEEAEFGQFRSKEKPRILKLKKSLLVAAVVAMMLMLVGCGAVIYSRIHMQVVDNRPISRSELSVEEIFTTYYPQSIPEGYTCVSGTAEGDSIRGLYYKNGQGIQIIFSLTTSLDFGEIHLIPPVEKTAVDVGGHRGTLTVSEAGAQNLVWSNETIGYDASLTTEDMEVDLIAMAESVESGAPMELNFYYRDNDELWDVWYPQQMPEGYTCTRVSGVSQDGTESIDYHKEGSGSIQYVISTERDLSNIREAPHSTMVWENVDIGGTPGRKVSIGEHQWILFWKNEAEGFNVMMMTDDPNVDLVELAKTVGPGPKLERSPAPDPGFTVKLEQGDAYVGYEPWYPQWIPEGYTETFVSDRAYGEQDIVYENPDGNWIRYTFYFRLGKWGRGFESAAEPEQVDINGHVGYRMPHGMIWTDEERGFAFELKGSPDVDLLKMARSVAVGPERPATYADHTAGALEEQGDYQITALPKGMFEDGLTGGRLEDGGGWYGYIRRWYFSRESNAEIYFEYETYISDELDSPAAMSLRRVPVNGAPKTEVEIGGCAGCFAQYEDTAEVAWATIDGNRGMQFYMTSDYFTAEELVEIARSVQKMN